MATLLETLGSLATPENVGMIGNVLGVDTSLVQQGLKVVGPTLLAAWPRPAARPTAQARS